MGNICCVKKTIDKRRTNLMVDTFDVLNTGGVMSLDAEEMRYLWTVYSQKKIEGLQNEITYWDKREPINLLSPGEKMDQVRFLQIIDKLHLTDDEVFEIWKTAKQLELDKLRVPPVRT